LSPYCGLKKFHGCQILRRLIPYFFFIAAGIKKNRKNMKNINHNVLGGLRNARNERNDKNANALYFFILLIMHLLFFSIFA
jgi:hypothetical protein